MAQNCCSIFTSKLCNTKRRSIDENIISKHNNELHITFCENDSLEKFEEDLNTLTGNSFLYFLKKRVSNTFISIVSVVVIMFALISASIYEDLLKKVIFELPFSWEVSDTVSIVFVIIFFLGLMMMPSILDGEGSEFKSILASWFNKDIKKLKRLRLAFSLFDKKIPIHIYNLDLVDKRHWVFRLLLKVLVKRFSNLNLYIRNDQIKTIEKRLKQLDVLNIEIIKEKRKNNTCDIDFLLSSKEQRLYSLMQLSSTNIVKRKDNKIFVSLELFEYCGRNFFENEKTTSSQLISGFQNFVNRSFDDFRFLTQEKSMQIYFTSQAKIKELEDEQRRLSYYLRNHIEECVNYFDNPISLLILYYYVRDVVLDEKRTIAILEKFILSVYKKQQYELIDEFWFQIAGQMFNPLDINSFEMSNNSYYRKLSIASLNRLIFLFERNGHFEQALLLAKYLYEINPNKYSVSICSLYERTGQFDKAYNSLPKSLNIGKNKKPSDIEVRYFQRKAWIVVSQRKDDIKQEGLDALQSLHELIFSHNDDNEPLWLWHYYNIKANYEEWNENYLGAVNNYKKCLSIPALGAFEYGATFVNMAIAYRFMYLTDNTQNFDNIDKSIELGKLGVLLKESVGDRDEMPVVLHNQALNVLYKMNYSSIDEKALKEIVCITDDAINILDRTKSIKRLGMLLIENIISKQLLGLDVSSNLERLSKHYLLVDENESKQIQNLYKEFIKTNKIARIEFLDNT
ncbi:hypothetical protein ACH5BK_02575 [Arcobacter sp. YIC-80]|uniref:hypothetical protein n=1 Tax=Arcobacter sp. YIC-80 TaxID=3376683 RepID=UPI00384E4A25